MDGKLTTRSTRRRVRFFALESTYPEPEQIAVAREGAEGVGQPLEDPVLPSPAVFVRRRHGSDIRLREVLEPLFVNTMSASSSRGTITSTSAPSRRTASPTSWSDRAASCGGQHRPRSGITAKGFDTDLAFMAAEIDGDQMYFNAISRTGAVDSGVITRRTARAATQ